MRVTQNMISNRVLQNLNKNMQELDKLTYQLSSGKKFSRPSEDPVGTVSAMQLNSVIRSHQQFSANVDQAMGTLNLAESGMQDLANILSRAKELAIQGANGTLTADSRQGIADEIYQLKEQVKSIANMDQGGKYIYAGTNSSVQPWDDSQPSGAHWRGNDQYIKFQVGPNASIDINVPGTKVFSDAPAGGEPLMDTLDGFINNLKNGNTKDIMEKDVVNLQANADNVLRTRVEIGARVNRLQMTKDRLTDQSNNLQGLLTNLQEIDMTDVITKLKSQQSTYEASLAAGAKVIQPTLMDFLK